MVVLVQSKYIVCFLYTAVPNLIGYLFFRITLRNEDRIILGQQAVHSPQLILVITRLRRASRKHYNE